MRKFYRTTITYEILSEEPIDSVSLETIAYETTEGHWSGQFKSTESEELNGMETALALQSQGSDPEFFRLDSEGNDIK